MAVLVKNPQRIRGVVEHIVNHYRSKGRAERFKAQVVTFDRECCVLYKAAMDEITGDRRQRHRDAPAPRRSGRVEAARARPDEEEKLLDRFRDPGDPLKFVIVTSKLLTGFDAPILQVMYLDKPMRDHNLLQAICRTNRPLARKDARPDRRLHRHLRRRGPGADFDEKAMQQVIGNMDDVRKALPMQVAKPAWRSFPASTARWGATRA
jgi:type I restriction enzyme, R subunit